jgi:opacity protein-like surface antigen
VGAEGEAEPGVSIADFQLDWTEALRARVGYLLAPATMLYGTAGWLTSGFRNTSLIGNDFMVPGQRVNALEIGAGVETALTEHWAARFEYQYAFAGKLGAIMLNAGHDSGPVSADLQMQYAKLGLVYMFEGR